MFEARASLGLSVIFQDLVPLDSWFLVIHGIAIPPGLSIRCLLWSWGSYQHCRLRQVF